MEMDNTAQDQSAFTEITLEAILSRENLALALKRVEANKGAPGVDGMRTEELRDYIFEHPGELTSAILSGKYRPAPVKRVTIPKPEKGKFRNLGIPTVIDRLVQQAVAQKLSDSYDSTFSMSSYGFRPTRSAHDAIFKVMGEADQGYVWAVDMDLEKFFDTVNHSRLIRKLSERIKDGRVISLISRMLKSGVSVEGKVEESEVGLMQGGPLSPLLANIYLDELDKELERRGHRFARYADDLVQIEAISSTDTGERHPIHRGTHEAQSQRDQNHGELHHTQREVSRPRVLQNQGWVLSHCAPKVEGATQERT